MVWVYVLDCEEGKLSIFELEDKVDVEVFVDEEFGINNVEYMVTKKLNMEIKNYG